MGAADEALDQVVAVPFAKDLQERNLFSRLRHQLERNLVEASGGDPEDVRHFTRMPVVPSKSTEKEVAALAAAYLAATPLIDFLSQPIKFTIPAEARFEHSPYGAKIRTSRMVLLSNDITDNLFVQ